MRILYSTNRWVVLFYLAFESYGMVYCGSSSVPSVRIGAAVHVFVLVVSSPTGMRFFFFTFFVRTG